MDSGLPLAFVPPPAADARAGRQESATSPGPSAFGLAEPRVVLDGAGQILSWNEELERLLGERAPLRGRKLGEHLGSGDALALEGWLAGLGAYEGRSPTPQPLTLRGAGGLARRVELISQARSGEDGFCVLIRLLSAPSCPIAASIEHLPLPAAVLQLLDQGDPESLVLLGLNAAARDRAGQALSGLVGRRLAEVAPLAREQGWLAECAAVARGGGARDIDLRPILPLKVGFTADLSLWPLPEGCVGVSLREEPTRAEPAGRDRMFLQIVEEIPAAVTVWALPEGAEDPGALRLVAANQAGEALLPRSCPAARGQALREILPADAPLERWRPLVAAVREGRPMPLSEWAWAAAGGATRTFARQCVPLEGRLVAVLCVDVTERKRTEEALSRENTALAQRNAELAAANRELRVFAHAAAEDLLAPLRELAQTAGLLARRYGRHLDAEGAQILDELPRAGARMQERIRRMLAYASLDPHAQRREPVSLEVLADQARAELQPALERAGASVVVGTLPMVEVDLAQFRQLYQELLSNAVKFAGPDPLRIEVGAQAEAERWALWVRDNGRGIPAHLAERVFALLDRGKGAQGMAGAGLGLALCRKIVENHGGRIWAEPSPGGGATVRFTLPRGGNRRGERQRADPSPRGDPAAEGAGYGQAPGPVAPPLKSSSVPARSFASFPSSEDIEVP